MTAKRHCSILLNYRRSKLELGSSIFQVTGGLEFWKYYLHTCISQNLLNLWVYLNTFSLRATIKTKKPHASSTFFLHEAPKTLYEQRNIHIAFHCYETANGWIYILGWTVPLMWSRAFVETLLPLVINHVYKWLFDVIIGFIIGK